MVNNEELTRFQQYAAEGVLSYVMFRYTEWIKKEFLSDVEGFKTYLLEEFGRREYKSVAMVDFTKPNRRVLAAIRNHPDDLNVLFAELSFAYNVRLYDRDSLIVFDEVQRCPQARQLVKALVADGRYDYIETGSLISLRRNVRNITIPSEEEAVGM